MGKTLGCRDAANGEFRIREPIEKASRLKQAFGQAIIFLAAAVFEFKPLNDARRSGAYSFQGWSLPPTTEVIGMGRTALRSHPCGVH
jgi:hypothetical protein